MSEADTTEIEIPSIEAAIKEIERRLVTEHLGYLPGIESRLHETGEDSQLARHVKPK